MQNILNTINERNLWDKTLVLKRNEYLKKSGSKDTNIYFVVEGSVKLFIEENEQEMIIRFGYRNNIIAALDCFISEKPSDLYIQAIKKTELKVISKIKFNQIIAENENFKMDWEQTLLQLIYQQIEREKDILIVSPSKRYQRVLDRSPQLFQEIPHKYIASYLRMTPETLSRLKSKQNS
jgi:CRP-like cAMP-binding protein